MLIPECFVTILMILVVALLIHRSGRGSGYCVAILPLVIVPLTHLIGASIYHNFSKIFSLSPFISYVIIDLSGLVTSCVLMGIISTQMKTKRLKYSYLISCGGFTTILFCVLISKMAELLIF